MARLSWSILSLTGRSNCKAEGQVEWGLEGGRDPRVVNWGQRGGPVLGGASS